MNATPELQKIHDDLYVAYLLGCEDECLPEPKTKLEFLNTFGDTYAPAAPVVAQREEKVQEHSLIELGEFLHKYDCLSIGWTMEIIGIFLKATKRAYEIGKAASQRTEGEGQHGN